MLKLLDFTLILRLNTCLLANPFLHGLFLLTGLIPRTLGPFITFLFCSTAGFVCTVRALSRSTNASKINALSFIHSFIQIINRFCAAVGVL